MFHLVQDSVDKLENNLIWVKHVQNSIFSWWFNITLFILVLGSVGYFLYAGYGTQPSEELKQIPFEANTWHNAVRNVPISNYGQTPATQIGDGIPGYADRTSATAF